MALIASIHGATRRVYLDPAAVVDGVLTFHPVIDVYPDYRALRASDESVRPFDSFMEARGNEPKNQDGTKRTPRFLRLLTGTKLVIPAGTSQVNVTGELISDDGSDPFDRSLLRANCNFYFEPPAAEVIKVTASGNDYSLEQIATALMSTIVEQNLDLRGAMRLLLSFAAGNATGLDGPNPVFRDLADTKNRIVAVLDGGLRSVTERDAS